MKKKNDFDSSYIGFIVGGAILGAIAGYVVKKVGPSNIMDMVKRKDIIPPTVRDIMDEFTARQKTIKD